MIGKTCPKNFSEKKQHNACINNRESWRKTSGYDFEKSNLPEKRTYLMRLTAFFRQSGNNAVYSWVSFLLTVFVGKGVETAYGKKVFFLCDFSGLYGLLYPLYAV